MNVGRSINREDKRLSHVGRGVCGVAEYGERKTVGNSTKSTDGHYGISKLHV